jgi:hypothetical protein
MLRGATHFTVMQRLPAVRASSALPVTHPRIFRTRFSQTLIGSQRPDAAFPRPTSGLREATQFAQWRPIERGSYRRASWMSDPYGERREVVDLSEVEYLDAVRPGFCGDR